MENKMKDISQTLADLFIKAFYVMLALSFVITIFALGGPIVAFIAFVAYFAFHLAQWKP